MFNGDTICNHQESIPFVFDNLHPTPESDLLSLPFESLHFVFGLVFGPESSLNFGLDNRFRFDIGSVQVQPGQRTRTEHVSFQIQTQI